MGTMGAPRGLGGEDPRAAGDAGEAAEVAPPPLEAVDPLERERALLELHRLTFGVHAERPRPVRLPTADDAETIVVYLDRKGASDCPTLHAVDLQGRPAKPRIDPALRSAAWVESFAFAPLGGDARPPLWWASGSAEGRCPQKRDGPRPLSANAKLWSSQAAAGNSGAWAGTPDASDDALVYAAVVDGDPDLFVESHDSAHRRRLAGAKGLDVDPRFDDTQTWVTWTASRPQGTRQLAAWSQFADEGVVVPLPTEIRAVRVDGTGELPITDYRANSFSGHVVGDRLWFTSNLHDPQRRDFDVYTLEIDELRRPRPGARPVRITFGPGFDGQPHYDPDTQTLLFVSDRSGKGRAVYRALVDKKVDEKVDEKVDKPVDK